MTQSVIQRFIKFNEENSLIKKGERVLACVSGGVDSVVLVELLHQAAIPFDIAHANFRLRGKDSEADEVFVKELAKKYKVACFVKHFDTKGFARKNHFSVEMAARELRYEWFYELAGINNFDKIATAHHQNDLVETVLLNLTRGTGLAGLHGIPLIQGTVIRPMLFLKRQEIEEFAKHENLFYRSDQSNFNTAIRRNRLRHKVIPELKKLNSSLEETIFNFTRIVTGYEFIMNEQLDLIRNKVVNEKEGRIFVDLKDLRSLPHWKVFLSDFLRDFGFNLSQIRSITEATEKSTGKLFSSHKYTVLADRQQLIVKSSEEELSSGISVDESVSEIETWWGTFTLERISVRDIADLKNPFLAHLDLDKIEFPLIVRQWQKGDNFYPFGMEKPKKLSDFFIDEKISRFEKKEIPIFESSGKIVWLAGLRVDNRFAITDSTRNVLKITFKRNK